MGTGTASATLKISKGSGLSLSVLAPDGTLMATSQGSSPSLTVSVVTGTYTFVVTGTGSKATFSLTVTYSQ